MTQYIDKNALVVEIERRLLIYTKRYNELVRYEVWATAKEIEHRIQGLKEVLSIINTLEVKEVDLEKEYKMFIDHDNGRSMFETAKHFFELGLKAQKGE